MATPLRHTTARLDVSLLLRGGCGAEARCIGRWSSGQRAPTARNAHSAGHAYRYGPPHRHAEGVREQPMHGGSGSTGLWRRPSASWGAGARYQSQRQGRRGFVTTTSTSSRPTTLSGTRTTSSPLCVLRPSLASISATTSQAPPSSYLLGSQRRWKSTRHHHYEAVVVGSGPAGITCVGNLLERQISPILWVDPQFDGGRINRLYREVPSNTKAKLFIDFAEAVEPFRRIVGGSQEGLSSGKGDAGLKALRELDPEKGCKLGYAADMCLTLTEGLKNNPGVQIHQGKVTEAILDENASTATPQWTVKITADSESTTTALTPRLILCTGSSPSLEPLPIPLPSTTPLDLDTALSPTRLTAFLSPHPNATIAVIGASHSAILVLMNLSNLASSSLPSLRIRWLTRHSLRYAEYMDGWILRDNTGLKGEAATWARENLEPETFERSAVRKFIEPVRYKAGDESGVFEEHLRDCTHYVQAIGYRNDPLPALKTSNEKEITPYFDHERGTFSYVKGSQDGVSQGDLARLPGLFGGGIAFPERVVDPYGNVEYAVGFFKFMKFIKRVSPAWN